MMGDTPIDNLSHLGAVKGALYYAQRMVPSPALRRGIARLAASYVNASQGRERRKFTGQLSSEDLDRVSEVRRNGWTAFGEPMPRQQVDEMCCYLADKDLVGLDGGRFASDAPPAGARLGSYPIATVLACPHVIELMNRSDMLGIAADYFGYVPTISGLRIDWSYPGCGQLRATLYDPDSLRRQYGAESLVRVHGSRGTLFMVDTWGTHKGNVPATGPRLLLQIQYSILPVLKFDYQPMPLDLAPQFSRYTNRLLIA